MKLGKLKEWNINKLRKISGVPVILRQVITSKVISLLRGVKHCSMNFELSLHSRRQTYNSKSAASLDAGGVSGGFMIQYLHIAPNIQTIDVICPGVPKKGL
jgi:hypothetical protein